jgi:hypothetical protein
MIAVGVMSIGLTASFACQWDYERISPMMCTPNMMMDGMMGVENPSSEEQILIISYLKAHSLKSVSPGMLPSPEWGQSCSKRHARGVMLFPICRFTRLKSDTQL